MAALNDLRAACRTAKAQGRAAAVPHGAAEAITATLLNSIASWSCVRAALQCLAIVLACNSHPAYVMRQEGGLKACSAALKRYGKRPEAAHLACRCLHRALACSALVGACMLKVRHAVERCCPAEQLTVGNASHFVAGEGPHLLHLHRAASRSYGQECCGGRMRRTKSAGGAPCDCARCSTAATHSGSVSRSSWHWSRRGGRSGSHRQGPPLALPFTLVGGHALCLYLTCFPLTGFSEEREARPNV